MEAVKRREKNTNSSKVCKRVSGSFATTLTTTLCFAVKMIESINTGWTKLIILIV